MLCLVNFLFFCSVHRTAPESGRIIVFLMHNWEILPHLLRIMIYDCVLGKWLSETGQVAFLNKKKIKKFRFYTPKATVQQSLLVSPSMGSMLATGESFCLGSHTFTVPVMHKNNVTF